jgi:hypothetical protein
MTKGPWEVFWIASPAGMSARIYSDDTSPNTDIAHIPWEWNGDGSNARLIALAPELAQILQRLVDACPAPALLIGTSRLLEYNLALEAAKRVLSSIPRDALQP